MIRSLLNSLLYFPSRAIVETPDSAGLDFLDLELETDDGMTDLLARAITVGAGSRWERATVRATIGLHATRVRDDGVSGEQGLMHFKRILHRAMPPTPVQTADQARVAKEMVRWWVEAYYERDT